ncbi:MAG TPA: SDR family oxidoreductase [Bacillota bacterium]|jgi:nucleoside-diphosphate-sugar epimerase|nr:SDR family oxidoreductase [Bacillota bacterium]HOL08763.1 SDR family oxidoreductase [Bacillota bacterium]HPO96334.1 SDR family oxidoreductase [Bacillota bacterium]
MATYLVTGGAGFIGSHIVNKLVAENEQVIVVDNLTTGSLENLRGIIDQINFIKADIMDTTTMGQIIQKVDYIIHQAAKISVIESVEDPVGFHDINVTATLNLLELAKKSKVRRFVLASSSAVYGANSNLPLAETEPAAPLSPYGVNKLIGEIYARLYYELYGLETVCLRYFNVFGPKQRPDSPYAAVIPKFVANLIVDKPVQIYGTGEQTRDFIFVEDVAAANIAACRCSDIGGEVFNIASGKQVSVNDLFIQISHMLLSNSTPEYQPPREGEVLHSVALTAKSETKLNFKPAVSFEEGLEKTVYWYKVH